MMSPERSAIEILTDWNEFKSRSPTFSEDSGKHSGESFHGPFYNETLLTTVRLQRKAGESLGIILAPGNSELEACPSIASLRPGSVALTSDLLVPGDRIQSLNGINTSRMRPEEVNSLLDNVSDDALFEIEYSLPNYASQNSLCVTSKVTEVTLERINGSLGITLRGGMTPDQPHLSRSLVITHLRPNGPAHRSGFIRVGDRLLKVDNHSLTNKTLLEAQQLLRENSNAGKVGLSLTTLTIEYDVSIMESVKYATGPLLVEIERHNEDLGLLLTNYCNFETDEIMTAGIYIERIIPASTADRCGALNVGDQLLAINETHLDEWEGTVADAQKLLRGATKLQVLPVNTLRTTSRNYTLGPYPSSPTMSGFSTINSRRSRNRNRFNRKSCVPKSFEYDSGISTNFSGWTSNMGVCHVENLYVTLIADRGKGYGLSLAIGEHSDNRPSDILIARITADSPAYRCGCMQTGDRILSVNHQSNLTLQEITTLLDLGTESNSKIVLQLEFDVADTIVPSSGIFTVKLAKRGPGLGITITATKNHPEEPFIISEIRRGSIAHRTGTLHAGDRLLEIDNRPLDHMSFESAFDIFQSSTNEIVTLKIEKTETDNANLFLDCVVYTVELIKYGGPLGITISGSEDCVEPIVLSRLTEGGLAEKTGALHAGDRILAINGENLENRPLSDAIRLLQTSGDRVQLKIARNLNSKSDGTRCSYSSPGLVSVDSAVASWDSNIGENNNDGIHETGEPKDTESVLSDPISLQEHDTKEIYTSRQKHDSQLQYYSDAEETFCPSPLPLPNYGFMNSLKYEPNLYGQSKSTFLDRLPGTFSNESILGHEIHHVTLFKDSIYDDYGFSLSDGLYEKGVYINRIRKGGPADIVGLLKPYDRILQVNDTKTQDFDCCLTVPLIASAGDRIELVVSRNPFLNELSEKGSQVLSWSTSDQENSPNKTFTPSQNTITKTL
ncbi:hypothetical protein FQR65_LT13065 [Abscondita terminalis]|nr:hypothetical protein FQR65_LT13065 [Abscondita terminalis]